MATGCIVTMLALPAGAALAPSRIKTGFDQDVLTLWDTPRVPEGQAKAASSTAPWFRNTFVLIRTDGMRPLDPAERAPSTEQTAKVQPAPLELAVPGTVQNLRRADRP